MGQFWAKSFDLQSFINTGIYDQNKTNVRGLWAQRSLLGQTVLGIPLTAWFDWFTASSGETVLHVVESDSSNRVYAVTAPATGLMRLLCADFDDNTLRATYRGKVILPVPYYVTTVAVTHTLRDLHVDDSDVNNIVAMFYSAASGANLTQHSGFYRTNKLALTDFVLNPASPTIPFATGNDQKAMYYDQNPAAMGILNTTNFEGGTTLPSAMGVDTATKRAYGIINTAASYWIYVRDYSTVPTWASQSVTFTLGAPGKVLSVGNPYSDNDIVIFPSATGLPTGLSANVPYYVRNRTAPDYELSTTFGGASIAFSGSSGTATVGRAFGATSAGWVHATGVITTAMTGTLLLIGNGMVVTPVAGHAALNGVKSLFLGTSSRMCLLPISEITSGATAIPNLLQVDLLGAANQIVAPTAVLCTWSTAFDAPVFTTSVSKVIGKKMQNGQILGTFGSLNNDYLEGVNYTSQPDLITNFGAVTVNAIMARHRTLHLIGASVGQRGMFSTAVGSDWQVGLDYIITKVIDIEPCLSFTGVTFGAEAPSKTSFPVVWARTNLTSDFSDETTGWIALPENNILSGVPVSGVGGLVNKMQFKIAARCVDPDKSNPVQLLEMCMRYTPLDAFSLKWFLKGRETTEGVSPAKTTFQQKLVYGTKKTLRLVVSHPTSGNKVVEKDTTSNYAEFSYSIDDGVSWHSFASANDYPNLVGSLVRYNYSSEPTGEYVISWIEV